MSDSNAHSGLRRPRSPPRHPPLPPSDPPRVHYPHARPRHPPHRPILSPTARKGPGPPLPYPKATRDHLQTTPPTNRSSNHPTNGNQCPLRFKRLALPMKKTPLPRPPHGTRSTALAPRSSALDRQKKPTAHVRPSPWPFHAAPPMVRSALDRGDLYCLRVHSPHLCEGLEI